MSNAERNNFVKKHDYAKWEFNGNTASVKVNCYHFKNNVLIDDNSSCVIKLCHNKPIEIEFDSLHEHGNYNSNIIHGSLDLITQYYDLNNKLLNENVCLERNINKPYSISYESLINIDTNHVKFLLHNCKQIIITANNNDNLLMTVIDVGHVDCINSEVNSRFFNITYDYANYNYARVFSTSVTLSLILIFLIVYVTVLIPSILLALVLIITTRFFITKAGILD